MIDSSSTRGRPATKVPTKTSLLAVWRMSKTLSAAKASVKNVTPCRLLMSFRVAVRDLGKRTDSI